MRQVRIILPNCRDPQRKLFDNFLWLTKIPQGFLKLQTSRDLKPFPQPILLLPQALVLNSQILQ